MTPRIPNTESTDDAKPVVETATEEAPRLPVSIREIPEMTAPEITAEYAELIRLVGAHTEQVTPTVARRCAALAQALAEIRTLRETLGIQA